MSERFTQVTCHSFSRVKSLFFFPKIFHIPFLAVHGSCGQLRVRDGGEGDDHHGPDWVLGDDFHSGGSDSAKVVKSSFDINPGGGC